MRASRPHKMLSEEEKWEIEQFELREGDFRRLLADPILAVRYDKRLNKALSLIKQVKYSLFDADKKMQVSDINKHNIKVIFEAVSML